jgi:hypothetical protein
LIANPIVLRKEETRITFEAPYFSTAMLTGMPAKI